MSQSLGRAQAVEQAALTWQAGRQADTLLFLSQHVPPPPSHYELLTVLQLLIASQLSLPPLASDLPRSALAGDA